MRAGVNSARGRWILFTDADLSAPIEEIEFLFDAAPFNDIVIGSRSNSDPAENGKPKLRQLTSLGANVVTKVGLGLPNGDTQCGFKLFERHVARDLFAAQRIDGFSFDAEILYLAKRLNYRVAEVPIRWFDAPGSTVRPIRTALRFIRDIVSIRLSTLLGRYPYTQTPRGSDPMDSRIRLAIVTAITPSRTTLAEYGEHLVNHLSAVPEVAEVIVLAETGNGVPSSSGNISINACWRFNSWLTPLRIIREVRRQRPDAVLFNAHFTSFGGNPISATLGLSTPAILSLLGIKNIVLLHNLIDTVDLETAGVSRGKFIDCILLKAGRAVTRMVLRADRVVTTMPRYVQILRSSYQAENVSLTPHASFETPPLRQSGENVHPARTARWGHATSTSCPPQDGPNAHATGPSMTDQVIKNPAMNDPADSADSADSAMADPETAAGPQAPPRTVLTFGRFGTYKKVELLIEAWELVRQHPALGNVQLVIAGTDSPNAPGYLEVVKQSVGDQEGLSFTGYVEEEDIPDLFGSSDVVVFPYSATTGSSGPLHQAGSYGRAVVAPYLGDFVQLINDEGFEVETFTPGDVLSLTDAIKHVLLDHSARASMEDANHAAASSLPMSDIAEWHVAHIESLLSNALRYKR